MRMSKAAGGVALLMGLASGAQAQEIGLTECAG